MRKAIKQSRIVTVTLAMIMVVFVGLPLMTTAMMQGTVINVPPGGDVQAVINSLTSGGTIVLQAGANYPKFTLKSGVSVVSSRVSEIVGRASPGSPLLAKVQSSEPGSPVVQVAAGAQNWAIKGLDISTSSSAIVVYDLVRVGESRQAQSTLAQVPSNGVIDQCYIHGWPDQNVQRGISLNGANVKVSNFWISDIHGEGFDTQAIAGWNGPGPFQIVNGYAEGAGENILFGGSDPASPDFIPSNITISRVHAFKPLSWNPYDQANFRSPFGQVVAWTTNPKACLRDDPAQTQNFHSRYVDANGCIARHWTVKNSLELKNARNVVIDGGIFENNWGDGQSGIPILFTVRNQEGTAPYSVITNVTFTNNTVKNAVGAFNLLGSDNEKPSQRCSGLVIRNNVFDQIKSHFLTMNGYDNVTIERNTHIQTCAEGCNTMELYGTQSNGFVYRDNVNSERPYGIHGPDGTIGKAALDRMTPGAIVTGNVIGTPYENIKIAGNEYPSPLVIGADYRTPYVGKGADVDQLLAAQKGTVTGPVTNPSPSPTPTATPTPSPTATPTPLPLPSPSPSATPSPSPTPTPTPTPTPIPQPVCTFTVPDVVSVPRWGSKVITVSLSMSPSSTATVSSTAMSGQVTVQPRSRTATGTSILMEFQVTVKNNSSSVRFDSPCGAKTMQVVVAR